jgi:hypothetical protein
MNYLLFAVYHNDCDVITHSREVEFENHFSMEDVLLELDTTGMNRENLHEVFVFQSATNKNDAPTQEGYWNTDDFGSSDEDNLPFEYNDTAEDGLE